MISVKKITSSAQNKKFKKIGHAILLIPIFFILIFLIGETAGGDISGIGHLFQLIPLILIILIANKYPYWGGLFLIFIGFVLDILYIISSRGNLLASSIVSIFLFFPLIISGILLASSSRPK